MQDFETKGCQIHQQVLYLYILQQNLMSSDQRPFLIERLQPHDPSLPLSRSDPTDLLAYEPLPPWLFSRPPAPVPARLVTVRCAATPRDRITCHLSTCRSSETCIWLNIPPRWDAQNLYKYKIRNLKSPTEHPSRQEE